MFIGREEEIRKLNRRYQNSGLEFIVIYGRRRVGKTALIYAFVKDKKTIFFPALRASAAENLEALSRTLFLWKHPDAAEAPVYSSFDAAFSVVTEIAKKKKRLYLSLTNFLILRKPSLPCCHVCSIFLTIHGRTRGCS